MADSSFLLLSVSHELVSIILGKTRLSGWDVAPFLDNWFLYLSWVGSGSRASFSWNINTFFRWLEFWNQFGYVFALSLWFQVTGLSWYL